MQEIFLQIFYITDIPCNIKRGKPYFNQENVRKFFSNGLHKIYCKVYIPAEKTYLSKPEIL